ncbi:P-loop containing nucleoside triphosphate hydrolases superfamily protein [Raphanus sativus]|uniref:Kinesin-like protein KIN-4C isoform X2 n=1 Tax=Raphanus sativus TaxID=3726 RepID=A0A6J0JCY2_RAPSA|nr:kinesin-like protein KIN-4C isoform X2 [Raphanus sativus]KAJ4887807.1 P-loop containing nucleoside triphosphate hydrolases superfamily protein [Raphanus sativus]
MQDDAECVKVAVNIRPLITSELLNGCTDCITVPPDEPQVHIGSHTFTYDYVFGSGGGYPSLEIYDHCVARLVDALFNGYNATVLAYGQTGSGKTYTMGTNYGGDGANGGIIPRVMEDIFTKAEATKDSTELLIRVSFIEIFKEDVFDLLDSNSPPLLRNDGGVHAKNTALSRAPIQIRETASGGITLAGVTEAQVKTKEEMGSYLAKGSLCRATACTNMNSQSSRSHAIFTITLQQKKISCSLGTNEVGGEDILCAKLHLVDLAGSERAKRTGADGMRLKEGIHINKGLLALGNVISALGDERKRKEGGHVPYRDSKLTRLLQDSLGGNSKTVMIACVSPADTNAEETLNTLKYANRARNIQNKAVINRDPGAAQMQKMRSQIEQLQTELMFYRGDSGAFDELQMLKHKISLLEASNRELQNELKERRVTCEHFSKRAHDAQVAADKLILTIESIRNGKSLDETESSQNEDAGLINNYVSKIQELEGELLHFKNVKNPSNCQYTDSLDPFDDGPRSSNVLFPSSNEFADCEDKLIDVIDECEFQEKEIEHCSVQEKLDMELKELDKRLEEKEAEMKSHPSAGTSVLKQHYEKKVHELEQEKRALQREIEGLRQNLATIPSAPGDGGAQKLKESYLQKLNVLETQVSELKKKQDTQAQLLRQKQKSDDAARKLQDDIHRIKSQKVQLQQKIKQESEQFRAWKASREKEVMQLKKEGRINDYEMQKLMALNHKQKLVLQRKTEEASQATKRLKDLLETRKASSRETLSGAGVNGPGTQALMQAIEHEIEVTVRVHEVRSEYERQTEERARMAKEVAMLREENELLKNAKISVHGDSMSPGARNSRIFALENMLATSSSTLVSMASQLSEAEERERLFGGRGRWNQVRTLGDAKNIMNYLFNLASSARCLAREKDVDCREKGLLIRELKEKIVKFSSFVRHLETQKADLLDQVKEQASALEKWAAEEKLDRENELKNPEVRNSVLVHEDMDTSDSEHERDDPDFDDEWKPDQESERESEQESVIKQNRKRYFKFGRGSSSVGLRRSYEEKLDTCSDEEVKSATSSDVCCTCTRKSSCKTMKCQCLAANGYCGPSCGCSSLKCSNRNASGEQNPHEFDEEDKKQQQHALASRGALLLRTALADKSVQETNDNEGAKRTRKPLSDIGNTTGKSNVPKPSQRKTLKKPVLQLVVDPQPPTTSSQEEAHPVVMDGANGMKLKLPRAMTSVSSNGSNLLMERNADQSVGESVGNGDRPSLSRSSDEKENHTSRI